jgi:hypothetical protein
MQDAAIQCSHFIFLCRYHKVWDPQALRDTWVPPQRDRPTLPKTDSAASCGENNENVLEELVSSSSNEGDISAGMCKQYCLLSRVKTMLKKQNKNKTKKGRGKSRRNNEVNAQFRRSMTGMLSRTFHTHEQYVEQDQ